MILKIFHTADVHLGLKFSSYPENVAKILSEARFETLERMIQKANDSQCHLFVVSGDLFDHIRVSQKHISRAAKILRQFQGVIALLPGNHDYVTSQEDDLWKFFQTLPHDRILILAEKRPYSLQPFDLDVCLYPAPCQNKHSKTHSLSWISETSLQKSQFQIGIAHGSFEGLTPDTEGEYYPMKKEDLVRRGLDLWLMGHIHIQFPPRPGESDQIFYPATPEPDGFDCRHEGKAWIIELSRDQYGQKNITPTSLSTGHFQFCHETVQIYTLQDLKEIQERYRSSKYQQMLLKLNFTGSLTREERAQFMLAIEELKCRFLYLSADISSVTLRLRPEDIDEEFTRESFPHRLLSDIAQNHQDSHVLQLAYELIKRTREIGGGAQP